MVSHSQLILLLRLQANIKTALVTAQLAHDLGIIGQEIEKLYGVLNDEDLRLQ
jgi:hypothetical protein